MNCEQSHTKQIPKLHLNCVTFSLLSYSHFRCLTVGFAALLLLMLQPAQTAYPNSIFSHMYGIFRFAYTHVDIWRVYKHHLQRIQIYFMFVFIFMFCS